MAARFPLDEIVHVELCARMAMELGGGTEILHDPDTMIVDADAGAAAACCAPPTWSRASSASARRCRSRCCARTWHAARHPLPRAVLGPHRQGRGGARRVRLHVPRLGARIADGGRSPPRGGRRRPRHHGRARAWQTHRAAAQMDYDDVARRRARLDALGRLPRARRPRPWRRRCEKPLRERGIPITR